MAAPTSARRLLMVGALVVVVAMLAAHPTEAQRRSSSFVFFSGPGCSGDRAVLSDCGCNTIPSNTRMAYQFNYIRQPAAAYNGPLCTGQVATPFSGRGTEQCSGVGWQSVFIEC